MAFKRPIPGAAIDQPGKEEIWLASKVIPMGWINSVSLFQHLHRRLGLQPQPLGSHAVVLRNQGDGCHTIWMTLTVLKSFHSACGRR